jgi:hypothetical protein
MPENNMETIERTEFERRLKGFEDKLIDIFDIVKDLQIKITDYALALVKLQTEHNLVCGAQEKKMIELEERIITVNGKAEGMQEAITKLRNELPDPEKSTKSMDKIIKILQIVFFAAGIIGVIAMAGWLFWEVMAHVKAGG